ncbi:D-beta-hydroxybutyrate dehydrogenase, mitochondrial-like [Acanthaster planci]|uniref:D-beta-hydroxybutyrate dehydrogenase, mitochondrial-like n=1 Tax=Acanthaster planci TaxID=133434 RepID=A0A8B7YEC9_ACAPL|nr:D-beta-hydroxybutyrate dehydrogenase, mitochondrial-like [Acanthaster planci]
MKGPALIVFLFVVYVLPCSLGVRLIAAVPAVGLLLFTWFGPPEKRLGSAGKAVLVTGCDTGIGNALARYLDKLGFRVFAGCLYADGEGAAELRGRCSDRLLVLQMDVTDTDQVSSAAAQVHKIIRDNNESLWGVVNNAAVNGLGELEWISLDQFKSVTEVNLWGSIRVIQAFLPLIRRSKGRIVNMSSISGRMSFPCSSPYCLTKYAVEAMSDSLRHEMYKWDVKVVLVEPANFAGASNFFTKENIEKILQGVWSTMSDSLKEEYGTEYFDYVMRSMCSWSGQGSSDLQPVLTAVEDAMTMPQPRERYVAAPFAVQYFLLLLFMLPTSWVDLFFSFMSGRSSLPRVQKEPQTPLASPLPPSVTPDENDNVITVNGSAASNGNVEL